MIRKQNTLTFRTKHINRVDEYGSKNQDGTHMETVCHIEILKDGRDFVARAHLANGSVKEYRHQIFEDVLTEMVIDLQEELSE
jgi:hypothetical protein